MKRCTALTLLAFAIPAWVGCTQGLETNAYTTRIVEATTPEEVLLAAELVLRREFGRVTVDRQQRRIVSQPSEYATANDSGTARDLVGAPSRMRRIAVFVALPRGDGVTIRLRVNIERQDTAHRDSNPPDAYRLSDSPAYTPIERDAATTRRQNTVWTKVRRDRRLERALLAELRERFVPPQEAETPDREP